MAKRMPPLHPGEILLTEFMEPLDLASTAWPRRWGSRHDA